MITVKSIENNSNSRELYLILETDRIQSINNLYSAKIGYRGKTAYPIIFKNPQILEYTVELEKQLMEIDFKEKSPWLWSTPYFNMTIQYVLNKNFGKRDLSNMIKIFEDVLFRHLGINDSRVLEIHTYKSHLPDHGKEMIMIRLSESTHNAMFKDGIDE